MTLLNLIAKLLGFKNISGEGTGHGYILTYEYKTNYDKNRKNRFVAR